MRTTLELPDPLFARLKARAASEGVTPKRSAATLPRRTVRWPSRTTCSAMQANLKQASEQVLFCMVTALELIHLVSFDRDFERFAGLQRLPLP